MAEEKKIVIIVKGGNRPPKVKPLSPNTEVKYE